MNIAKILLIIILLVSVVSAFVAIPYLAALAAVLGLVNGVLYVEEDRRIYIMLLAVVLGTSAGALGGIPEVGGYLTAMLTTLGSIAAAGAIGVIGKGISERLT